MNKHLKALLVVGGLTLLIVVAFLAYKSRKGDVAASSEPGSRAIELNAELPGFTATDLTGKGIQLSDFKGKIVVVNFWASWCGPCIEEVPSLIGLLKTFPNDLVLIAISGDSNQADIDSFMKSFPEMKNTPNIHVIWDADKKLTQQYQIFRLPESFVVNKDLKLVKKISGSIDWHNQDAIGYMKELAFPGQKAPVVTPPEVPQDEHPVNAPIIDTK